jgi:hypothetical protein
LLAPGAPIPAEVLERALSEVQLPDEYVQRLRKPLLALGFRLEDKLGRVRDYARKLHLHHRIEVKGGYIALMYVGYGILSNAVHSPALLSILLPCAAQGAVGVVVFSDVDEVAGGYRTLAEHLVAGTKTRTVKFVTSIDVEDYDHSTLAVQKDLLEDWMGLSQLTPKVAYGALTREDLKADRDTVNKIIQIIREQADNAPINLGGKGYLKLLIQKTYWPGGAKVRWANGLSGDSAADVQALMDYALDQGSTPGPGAEDYTFVGSLLAAVLSGDHLDAEDQAFFKNTIVKYSLIRNYSP